MSEPGDGPRLGTGLQFPQKVGLPPDAQGSEYFESRDGALKIFRKFKEISNRQDTADLFRQNFDPTKPGAFAKQKEVMQSIDRLTMEELGLTSSITDWNKFPGILKTLVYKWSFDPVVMKELMGFVVIIKRRGFTRQVGSEMEDVGLVSMAKEEVSLSSLHVHKERPLVLIASSLS
ncbi:uncharacterized protein LOC110974470 [Acanthaster planci]|uniref:Uncharacterized protein LOC110974470 n=1 Tax=Acanthaster planci TaxID=133434 RepID=A0A8B7XNS0_ACAPL|nr:uncharacterized protein LOC110974470 [Acanthaster planci]